METTLWSDGSTVLYLRFITAFSIGLTVVAADISHSKVYRKLTVFPLEFCFSYEVDRKSFVSKRVLAEDVLGKHLLKLKKE